jgi:hypothetical protein
MTSPQRPALAPLFLVSAASIGFEIQLTRFFAISSWSEYGYWVISIAMVGLSLSGVALSLFQRFFLDHSRTFLAWTPPVLMAFAVLGYYGATLVSFNPLEFQNKELWFGQLLNVGKYYLALFPFFFLTGLYIGLNFLVFLEEVPRLYAADLVGAGFGGLWVLACMFLLHPFFLLAGILPLLFLATLAVKNETKPRLGTCLVIFVLSEVGAFFLNRADFCEYKAVYPALHVEEGRVAAEKKAPRGYYLVMDNFTERLDKDLSNNYALLNVEGPPQALGVYKDGSRVGELPKEGRIDTRYSNAALDVLPYRLRPGASALQVGSQGGFKIVEALAQGAASITALEPDPVLYSLVHRSMREGSLPEKDFEKCLLLQEAPLSYLGKNKASFGIIDFSSGFLDQAEANRFAFTREAVQAAFLSLDPNGVLSLPASMRELTVYALKLLETSRSALEKLGVAQPETHLLLYRSAWNCRVLVFKKSLGEQDLRKVKEFCSKRSFDISYYRGLKPGGEVWNELPPAAFEDQTKEPKSNKSRDVLRDDCLELFSPEGDSFAKNYFFNLSPSTLDRPFFYSVLRLKSLGKILDRLYLVPKEEIGYLVNLAVLAQSVLWALLVLFLPFLTRGKDESAAGDRLGPVVYFACLGLGYLFVEIMLIEKASFFLGDRTSAFSLVICGMLVFSGAGSWWTARFSDDRKKALRVAMGVAGAWMIFAFLGLDALLARGLGLPMFLKQAVLLLALAPVSFGLGMPFALGLGAMQKKNPSFVTWAWALNGAFSVVATPLANLIAVSGGTSRLLLMGMLIYGVVYLAFPKTENQNH